jgi:hypothetical protein
VLEYGQYIMNQQLRAIFESDQMPIDYDQKQPLTKNSKGSNLIQLNNLYRYSPLAQNIREINTIKS